MFKFFPTNYVWNLAINIAIEMGAKIGEIEVMCTPLQDAAQAPDAEGTLAFRDAWERMADQLCGLADEDEQRGHDFSAGEKYSRAAIYYLTAERLQAHGAPGRMRLYQRFLEVFHKGLRLSGEPVERVEIPFGDTHIAGLLVRPPNCTGPMPVLLQLNGLDSMKEMKLRLGLPRLMAQRGVASLLIDQPGTGEALRLQGLKAVPEAESWGRPVVDWLTQHPDIDPRRIGCEGISLGGYFCPRVVAFEPRIACGVVWGANHDWRDVQRQRLAREGSLPVPHYWEHVRWVWGARDQDEFLAIAERVHLDDVLDRIRVPFLVTHGEQDAQIPVKWARRTYEQLVNSPDRELKVFTDREGGVQHASADNPANAGAYIADWVAQRLGGSTSARRN